MVSCPANVLSEAIFDGTIHPETYRSDPKVTGSIRDNRIIDIFEDSHKRTGMRIICQL
jgi:hypothetical protein